MKQCRLPFIDVDPRLEQVSVMRPPSVKYGPKVGI